MEIEQEALNQIGEWMVKYDTDVEAIDLKIQVQRNAHAAMKDKRMMLEQTVKYLPFFLTTNYAQLILFYHRS